MAHACRRGFPGFWEPRVFLPSLFLSIARPLLPDSHLRELGKLQTCQPSAPRPGKAQSPKNPQAPKLTPRDYRIKSKGFYRWRDGKSPLFVDYHIISPGWYWDAQGKHTLVTVDFQIPKWCCKVCACLIIFYARLCNTKCMLQQSVS